MDENIHTFVGVKRHGMASGKNRFDFRIGRGNHMVTRGLNGNALAQEPGGKNMVVHLRERNYLTRKRREQGIAFAPHAKSLEKPAQHDPPCRTRYSAQTLS